MRLWVVVGFCLSLSSPLWAASDSVPQPTIVIIIDDVGDNFDRGQAAVDLPGPLTFAVLPHSPFGPKLAKRAMDQGSEVMLHAPMENTHDRPLGPGALTHDLNQHQYRAKLEGNLDSIPGVVGLNNHMGSLLTTLRPQMEWTMELADQRRLFFVDSKTTADSVAWKVAKAQGIPYLIRDVFLDHEQTLEFVHQQFQQTLEIARERGYAVAIGHPYPVTIQYLQWALPQLDRLGVRLGTASSVVAEKAFARHAFAAKSISCEGQTLEC